MSTAALADQLSLEQLNADYLDTPSWPDRLAGRTGTSLADLQIVPATKDLYRLLDVQKPRGQTKSGGLSAQRRINLTLSLAVYPPEDTQPNVTVPIQFTERRWGRGATTLRGKDSSGGLHVTLSLAPGSKNASMSLEWRPPEEALPALLLIPLRLLSGLKAPNRVALREHDTDISVMSSLPESKEALISDDYLHIVERLERVQRLSNTWFSMPRELNQEDIDSLVSADRLLQGKTVVGTWREAITIVTPTASGRDVLANQAEEAAILIASEESVMIAGNPVYVGVVARHLLAARVAQWTHPKEGAGSRLVLVPGSVNEFEAWLVRDGSTGVDQAIPGVSRQFRQQVEKFIEQNDEALRRLAL